MTTLGHVRAIYVRLKGQPDRCDVANALLRMAKLLWKHLSPQRKEDRRRKMMRGYNKEHFRQQRVERLAGVYDQLQRLKIPQQFAQVWKDLREAYGALIEDTVEAASWGQRV